MTGDLPEGLAARYAMAPLTLDALDEVFALSTADRVAVLGLSRLPREALRIMLTSPWPSTTLGVRSQGRLVQVWRGDVRPGALSPTGAVWTHPELGDPADVEALESAGWRHIVRWASDHVADAHTAELRTERPTRDGAGRGRLARHGFVDERVLWVMEAEVDADRPRRSPPDGFAARACADPRAVYDIFMSGFAGTYGFVAMSFEEFMTSRIAIPGHDPSLWYVATLHDRPVGAMTVTRINPERSAMHVSELAVLADFRGRGIASSLLDTAFVASRAAGMRLLTLFADSESDDDAPRLYASVGFEVVQATVELVRPLVRP